MLNATHVDTDTLSEDVSNLYRNLFGRRPELIGPHLQLTVTRRLSPSPVITAIDRNMLYTHAGCSLLGEPQFHSNAIGDINQSITNKGPSIIDTNDHRGIVLEVGDAQIRRERH